MKFYAEPNLYVRIAQKNMRNGRKNGFYFDDKGEFETEDTRLIARLLAHGFKSVKEEEILPFDEVIEEPTIIPLEEEKTEIDVKELKTDVKKIVCKECGEEFENMGLRLAHSRKAHKGGKK